jgi:hypothetical protein
VQKYRVIHDSRDIPVFKIPPRNFELTFLKLQGGQASED